MMQDEVTSGTHWAAIPVSRAATPAATLPSPGVTLENSLLHEFADEFLVRCPCCEARAVVRREPIDALPRRLRLVAPWHVECPACGFSEWACGKVTPHHTPLDWHFQLPLWLQEPCCGHVLWAYNQRHLRFIEQLVASSWRHWPERSRPVEHRVAAWVLADENRASVLRALAALHARC